MPVKTLLDSPALSVVDYRCALGPTDVPYWETHARFSLSYVRRGSFACECRGGLHQLVAGALLVGSCGDQYRCSHQHSRGGDECLSFQFSSELIDTLDSRQQLWIVGALPPTAEVMVAAEFAQATVRGESDVGLDEAGLMLAHRFLRVVARRPPVSRGPNASERRRAIRGAEWIGTHSRERIHLACVARELGASPFHFLRVFSKVLGVTPHQYLVRSRLRNAARLLADSDRSVTAVALDVGFDDLSNFVRTFRRAAGVSPGEFRRMARRHRKVLQVPDHAGAPA